jgi:hypothetical protein
LAFLGDGVHTVTITRVADGYSQTYSVDPSESGGVIFGVKNSSFYRVTVDERPLYFDGDTSLYVLWGESAYGSGAFLAPTATTYVFGTPLVTPARSPIPEHVSEEEPFIYNDYIAKQPIVFQGVGVIRPEYIGSELLAVSDVTIQGPASISAEGLSFGESVTLKGSGVLRPRGDGALTILPTLVLKAEVNEIFVPELILGNVGENYDIVPSKFVLNLTDSRFTQRELNELHKPLVSATTLSNCDKWKPELIGGEEFDTVCENEQTAVRAEGGTRTLFLIKKGGPDAGNSGSLGAGAIAGIAIVVLIVVIAAIVLALYMIKKNARDRQYLEASLKGEEVYTPAAAF